MMGTPGGRDGTSTSAMARAEHRRDLAVDAAHVGDDEDHEAGGEGGVEPQRRGVTDGDAAAARRAASRRSSTRTRRCRSPRRPAAGRLGRLPDGHGRRLVDHELGRQQPATAAALARSAPARGRRRRCGRRAGGRWPGRPGATRRRPITPTAANCDAPVNTSSDIAHGLGDRQPAGHRQHAERHAEDPDGDVRALSTRGEPGDGRSAQAVFDRRARAPPSGGRVTNADAGWPVVGLLSAAHTLRTPP